MRRPHRRPRSLLRPLLAAAMAAGIALAVVTPAPILAASAPPPAADALPTLIVEAPPELAGVAERVRRFDRTRLAGALQLTGLTAAGPPIRVLLAPEGSAPARAAPPWAAGYADGRAGVIVLMPSRITSYPDESLEMVLQHEVAHVLVARATAGRSVPRWFNEGMAMVAAREWGLGDRTRLVWGMVSGGRQSLDEVDARFASGATDAQVGYALSRSFVNELLRRHGDDAGGHILAEVGRGASFNEAFLRVTGENLPAFERSFWRFQNIWSRWVPILTSSAVLWIAVTALALLAFYRRRRRDAELAEQWEEEEQETWYEKPGGGLVN